MILDDDGKGERQIIKANPGWYVAYAYRDHGTRGITLDPIIAWLLTISIESYHRSVINRDPSRASKRLAHISPYPITAEGLADMDQNNAGLKTPDGLFIVTHDNFYFTEDEFMDAALKEDDAA